MHMQEYGYEIMPYRSKNAYISLVNTYGGTIQTGLP